MKKILTVLALSVTLVGCELQNEPQQDASVLSTKLIYEDLNKLVVEVAKLKQEFHMLNRLENGQTIQGMFQILEKENAELKAQLDNLSSCK